MCLHEHATGGAFRPWARICWTVVVAVLLVPAWAGDDDDDERRQDDRRIYQSALAPLGTLGIAGVTGIDPLEDGTVEVSAQGNVAIRVEGARPNASYVVSFCRFALTNVGCAGLVEGTFETDGRGNARVERRMPLAAGNWSGIFLVSRNGAAQFATAFTTRAAAASGSEIEIKGQIGALDPASNSFRLDSLPVPVFVTTRTNLVKIDSLSQLRVGDRVEVRGIAAGGFIEATRVKSED
ncbi:MAG: hypothetical protein JNK48_13835 [Bryobacterales bacterium]|nr:hypothetical protein [Bryobacterales bacterium]